MPGQLCASLDGFSLHAKVALEADDHDGRERLCRYLARPAIASERLSL
ncbi:MAG: transposase, partial [Planctomycetota bacterium]